MKQNTHIQTLTHPMNCITCCNNVETKNGKLTLHMMENKMLKKAKKKNNNNQTQQQ